MRALLIECAQLLTRNEVAVACLEDGHFEELSPLEKLKRRLTVRKQLSRSASKFRKLRLIRDCLQVLCV